MRFVLRTPLRFIAAACGLAVLTACAGRDVTAPTRAPAERRPETLLPDEPLPMLTVANSSFFDPPPNSSPNAINALTPVEFGGIPDSTWVVVTVNGDVQQRWNPECDTRPPYWPCQTGSVLTTPFGLKPWDEGAVKMWANQNGVTSPIKLRGQGGENTTTAIGLKFFASGGTLLGRVNAYPKWAWDPNYGTGPFSYYLSGGYQVDAMPVASPVSLTASDPLDSLGTRQYTVQPLYGLKFINPLDWSWTWPDGAIFWYFIPGDAGPKPEWSQAIDIPECQFQTVCNYAPPGPGRMQAAAYVETQYVVIRSEPVQRPTTCPTRIRGGLSGYAFGYEEGGYSWTANWNRYQVLDERNYDRALYTPEVYDGYAQGKGDYIISRDGDARWYNPRLSVWCYAIDVRGPFGIVAVQDYYVVVGNHGAIERNQ